MVDASPAGPRAPDGSAIIVGALRAATQTPPKKTNSGRSLGGLSFLVGGFLSFCISSFLRLQRASAGMQDEKGPDRRRVGGAGAGWGSLSEGGALLTMVEWVRRSPKSGVVWLCPPESNPHSTRPDER